MLCGISSRFQLLSPSERQVAHALLTRSPLTREPKLLRPFDLHVLGTPPAFVLSQDQTLYKLYLNDRSRSNLYRAICHSLKLFILSFTGNWLNPVPPSFQLHIFRCAPVWCFSFRSLFNLQGTRPTTAEQSLFYHMSAILSTTFLPFSDIFRWLDFTHVRRPVGQLR